MSHSTRPAPLALVFALALLPVGALAEGSGEMSVDPPPTCTPPPRQRSSRSGLAQPSREPSGMCFAHTPPSDQCLAGKALCTNDLAMGKTAWKYFENNYQSKTGFVNSNDNYPSTTMWDTASALAATMSAQRLGIITEKDFDDRIVTFLSTMNTIKLFHEIAPNKAYNAATGEMTDYANRPTDGIGYSALDLSRLVSWLNLLECMYPKHATAARRVVSRWSTCDLAENGEMRGAYVDPASKRTSSVQEGRLGYEQYGGKGFQLLGIDQSVSANYKNRYAQTVSIYGVDVPYDVRDPRKFGAYNYVVTESYALDAIEFGIDDTNAPLLASIYEVQKRRWQDTGIITAVSEDNVDRAPYFVYNTIYAAGTPWSTITDTGVDQDALKSTSTKAAFTLAALFPNDDYSAVLLDKVASAYDPARGWYSGVYESGIGYNKSITANTNGIILETLLYKTLGALQQRCAKCQAKRPRVVVPGATLAMAAPSRCPVRGRP